MPRTLLLIVALACTVPPLSGCSTTFRDVVGPDHHLWLVTVENRTRWPLEILVDGRFFAVVARGSAAFTEVRPGHHVLEAYDDAGYLVARRDAYIDSDLVWILDP